MPDPSTAPLAPDEDEAPPCPHCGRGVPLRKDGTLRLHRPPQRSSRGTPYCDGSYRPAVA